MIRQYLFFNNYILKLNIVFSFLLVLLVSFSSHAGLSLIGIIRTFLFSFLTGGYLFGIYCYELFYKKEYYYFYNLGIPKLRLLLISYLLHLIISIPILLVKLYA